MAFCGLRLYLIFLGPLFFDQGIIEIIFKSKRMALPRSRKSFYLCTDRVVRYLQVRNVSQEGLVKI